MDELGDLHPPGGGGGAPPEQFDAEAGAEDGAYADESFSFSTPPTSESEDSGDEASSPMTAFTSAPDALILAGALKSCLGTADVPDDFLELSGAPLDAAIQFTEDFDFAAWCAKMQHEEMAAAIGRAAADYKVVYKGTSCRVASLYLLLRCRRARSLSLRPF